MLASVVPNVLMIGWCEEGCHASASSHINESIPTVAASTRYVFPRESMGTNVAPFGGE